MLHCVASFCSLELPLSMSSTSLLARSVASDGDRSSRVRPAIVSLVIACATVGGNNNASWSRCLAGPITWKFLVSRRGRAMGRPNAWRIVSKAASAMAPAAAAAMLMHKRQDLQRHTLGSQRSYLMLPARHSARGDCHTLRDYKSVLSDAFTVVDAPFPGDPQKLPAPQWKEVLVEMNSSL